MADTTFLPAERAPRPAPYGGTERADVLLTIDEFPLVQARRDLDARLLSATCGVGDIPDFSVDVEDLELLILVAVERFSGTSALLRQQALAALGVLKDERADSVLIDLARRVVEHDAVRIGAAAALRAEAGLAIAHELIEDSSPQVADWARARLDDRRPRITTPQQPRHDCPDQLSDSCCVAHR